MIDLSKDREGPPPVPFLPLFRPPSPGEGAEQRHLGPCQKVLSPGRGITGHVMGSLARVFAPGSLAAWRDARVQGDTTRSGGPNPHPRGSQPFTEPWSSPCSLPGRYRLSPQSLKAGCPRGSSDQWATAHAQGCHPLRPSRSHQDPFPWVTLKTCPCQPGMLSWGEAAGLSRGLGGRKGARPSPRALRFPVPPPRSSAQNHPASPFSLPRGSLHPSTQADLRDHAAIVLTTPKTTKVAKGSLVVQHLEKPLPADGLRVSLIAGTIYRQRGAGEKLCFS